MKFHLQYGHTGGRATGAVQDAPTASIIRLWDDDLLGLLRDGYDSQRHEGFSMAFDAIDVPRVWIDVDLMPTSILFTVYDLQDPEDAACVVEDWLHVHYHGIERVGPDVLISHKFARGINA